MGVFVGDYYVIRRDYPTMTVTWVWDTRDIHASAMVSFQSDYEYRVEFGEAYWDFIVKERSGGD